MKFTEEETRNIIDDYNNGMTPKEMSEKYNRNSGTIIGKLKSLGVYKPKNHRYTEEEIEFIKNHYPKGELDVIFERFPFMTKAGLIKLCHKHNISADYYNNKKWTDGDLKVVEEYYYSKSLDEIYEMIDGRHSLSAIQTKALKYFGYSKDRTWTDEELDILKEYYPVESVDDVCEKLPNRTRDAIIRQANNLGIQSYFYLNTYWSDEDEKFLIDNWKNMSDIELAEALGKNKHAIADKRGLLGLQRVKHYNEASYFDVKRFIRGNIWTWKSESMKKCNYQCILTGDKNDFHIHHMHSFGLIFDEIVEENNIILKDKMSEYSVDELEFILDRFIEKQKEYPLGVCVRTDLHKLFHKLYGKRTTVDMWNRFAENYKNGEISIT